MSNNTTVTTTVTVSHERTAILEASLRSAYQRIDALTQTAQCEKILLLPNNNEKRIAAITLPSYSGVIKRTGKQPGHYSWWRSNDFNLLGHVSLHAVSA